MIHVASDCKNGNSHEFADISLCVSKYWLRNYMTDYLMMKRIVIVIRNYCSGNNYRKSYLRTLRFVSMNLLSNSTDWLVNCDVKRCSFMTIAHIRRIADKICCNMQVMFRKIKQTETYTQITQEHLNIM